MFTEGLYHPQAAQNPYDNSLVNDYTTGRQLPPSTDNFQPRSPSSTRSTRDTAAFQTFNKLSSTNAGSRPLSPRTVSEHQQWMKSLTSRPAPKFDRTIVNIFLGLFQEHVAEFFPVFRRFRVTKRTPQHLYLAMAAVGGVYCSVPGSAKVSQWFHYNARRDLLTGVCCLAFTIPHNPIYHASC